MYFSTAPRKKYTGILTHVNEIKQG